MLPVSTDPVCIPRIPSCGRVFAVRPVPSLHILVPPPPMVVPRSLCVRQLLEYIGMLNHIPAPLTPILMFAA